MNKWKIFLVFGILMCGVFVVNNLALATCCKQATKDKLELKYVREVYNNKTKSECDAICAAGTICGSYFDANKGINSQAKSCTPESGCCQLLTVGFYPEKKAYYASGVKDCETLYCPGGVCIATYHDKWKPDAKFEMCAYTPPNTGTQTGCCKKVVKEKLIGVLSYKIDVYDKLDQAGCAKACDSEPVKDRCQTYFRVGSDINSGAKSCKPESGCCEVMIPGSMNPPFKSFYASSKEDCDIYCPMGDCVAKYLAGLKPDAKKEKCAGNYKGTGKGCCKTIIEPVLWDLNSIRVYVDGDYTKDQCDLDCTSRHFTACKSQYRINTGINTLANTCAPEAGCCLVTEHSKNGTKAFFGNSQTECNLYCGNGHYCSAQFVAGKSPDGSGKNCGTPSVPVTPPAQTLTTVKLTPVQLTNPLDADTIPAIIANIIRSFLGIIGAIALAMFVFGGFRWLTAAGNDKSIQAGRDTLLWAGIGLILIFLSYIAVGYVMQVLGVI